MSRFIGDKYLIFTSIANVFYTDPGVRQGFTFKEFSIFGYFYGRWFNISLPLWIMEYNRQRAESFYRLRQELWELEKKWDEDEGSV